ncbi:hypothetical protein F4861DRAFT_253217 [Xylaria intraflava]|nr:hypothetical protein F4861DRAFT_253217 [Xylaria intraflava]
MVHVEPASVIRINASLGTSKVVSTVEIPHLVTTSLALRTGNRGGEAMQQCSNAVTISCNIRSILDSRVLVSILEIDTVSPRLLYSVWQSAFSPAWAVSPNNIMFVLAICNAHPTAVPGLICCCFWVLSQLLGWSGRLLRRSQDILISMLPSQASIPAPRRSRLVDAFPLKHDRLYIIHVHTFSLPPLSPSLYTHHICHGIYHVPGRDERRLHPFGNYLLYEPTLLDRSSGV